MLSGGMPSHCGVTPSHKLKAFPLSVANPLLVSCLFIHDVCPEINENTRS